MKTKPVGISGADLRQAEGVAPKGTNETDSSTQAAATTKAGKNYNVALSDKSKQVAGERAKALDIARNTSAIREDRVAQIKRQIADGTYQMDSGNTADGILREAIRDKLATMPEE